MKVLVILLVLIGITLFSIDDAFGAVGWTSQEIYDFSDIIAVGKVTNVNSTFSPTMNLYHIQVEKFLKNPQNSTELLALGSKTESIRAGNEVFDAGDRALFFLVDNIVRMYPIYSGIYEVSTVSQSMDPNWDKCNIFEKNIPPDHWVFGGRSNHLHASQENKTDDFVTGKKITISHDIFNHEPVTKKVDFRMTIKNIDEPESLYEFTETAYRILEPCTVYETVSWSFTPSKPANYLAEFNNLKGNSIGITIPVQSDNDFSGLAPLKQVQSGIPFNEIQCKQNLVLIQKYDGSPACVTESTKTKLIERGWTKDVDEQQSIPVIGHIKDFYHDVRKVESGKTFQIPLEYYPDGIPENLRFGVIGAEIPDARHEFIFNGIEKLPEGIEVEIDNAAMPPNLIITTKQGLSGEQIIGLIIVNDTNGTKELHQYQIRIEN